MKKKIALVLGSGGARGTAHIGVIRALIAHGFEITSVSGTSMGALVGGIYAAGKLDEYEEWMTSLSKTDVFNLVDFTLSMNGIIKANKVIKTLLKFIPDHQIEDLAIPFSAVATDLLQKKEVVFTQGSLFEAIRASISIPMVITPMKKNETLFVDGGVLNPVPVNRVFRHDGDLLVAVNVNAQIPFDETNNTLKEWESLDQITQDKLSAFHEKIAQLIPFNKKDNKGYFHLIGDTTGLMLAQITKLTMEINPPDLLIEISRSSCSVFDFYKAKEQIQLGKDVTIQCLKKWNKKQHV
ncbi:MAG: patatin-like phospholipase family protein [Prolixibacteraceae bacterium]